MTFPPIPQPEKPTPNGTLASATRADHDALPAPYLSGNPANHADLARWLLAHEIAESKSTKASAAAERVCQKVCQRLSRVVSPSGSQALLDRALHLARRQFPLLAEIRAGTVPEATLVGLDELLSEMAAEDAANALLSVLAALLALLAGFIGEDLALRLLREVWPDLPLRDPSRAGNLDGQRQTDDHR